MPQIADVTRPLPFWAKVLDALALLFAAVGVAVLLGGTIRLDLLQIHIVARSSVRPFVIALVLIAVRHLVARRDPLHRRVFHGLIRTWQLETTRAVAGPFLATRVTAIAVALLSVGAFGLLEPGFRISNDELVNLPARWDAGWYLNIVHEGYSWNGDPRATQNVAFFPVLPVLMSTVARVLHVNPLAAAMIVAVLAFALALSYVFRLAREMLGPERARLSIWFLATYPFAVYYSAPYTEALYLCAAAGAVWHYSRQEWVAAAAWAWLCGISRPNGWILGLLLLLLVPVVVRRAKPAATGRTGIAAVLVAGMPAVGVATYCAYLFLRFGDPLVWIKSNHAWGRTLQTDLLPIQAQNFSHPIAYMLQNPYDFLNAVAAIAALCLVPLVWRRVGPAYALFVLANMLPPIMFGGVMAMGRLTSTLFPLFIALAAAVRPGAAMPILVVFASLQTLAVAMFFTWHPLI